MIKLNLGSHDKDIGNEYVNIDALDLPNVDIMCDLAKTPFSFKIKNNSKIKDNSDWDFLFEEHYTEEEPVTFQLPSNSVDEILMDEVLEHISFRFTSNVLKEIYRILKVGGKIKIQVPDCGAAMKAWVEGKVCNCVPHKAYVDGTFKAKEDCPICGGKAIMDWQRWLYSFTGAQKHFPHDIHKAIFTKKILFEEMTRVGFDNINFKDNPVKLKLEGIK